MNLHDDFWINQATKDDYADPDISTEKQVEYLIKSIKPSIGHASRILEFGCGYGRLTREIKQAFPETLVVGIDINPKILDEAKKYSDYRTKGRPSQEAIDDAPSSTVKGVYHQYVDIWHPGKKIELAFCRRCKQWAYAIRVMECYGLDYICSDTIIDIQNAIYSVAVLQHLPNERKRQFIRSAAKMLEPAGRLIIQYVEGDTDLFLTHNAHLAEVRKWCQAEDLVIVDKKFNFIQEGWTWLVAEKV